MLATPPYSLDSTMQDDGTCTVDWLDFTRARSAHFIAEKTCEMICYLWHATPPNPYPSPNHSPSSLTYSPHPAPATSAHQLHVFPEFVSFVQKILETTQVSQSVIVLSLHYIYKLKHKTKLVGPSGSEYRIAVGGLMMANKFLDDNTYTNKTWSEVSGIPLCDINKMEADFLKGVEFNLYVDVANYKSWLNLLKGLVMAKERDLLRAKGGRRYTRKGAQTGYTPGGRARYYRPPPPAPPRHTPRARSTSPISRSSCRQLPPLASPSYDSQQQQPPSYDYKPASYNYSPSPAPSSLKRSAATAFSPTSASFSQVPLKKTGLPPIQPRPGITLQIPLQHDRQQPHSNSPMDGLPLQGFAKMNLNSASATYSNSLSSALGPMPSELEREREREKEGMSSTLVQPYSYSAEEQRRNGVPRHLYFYTLACSPLEDGPSRPSSPVAQEEEEEDMERERVEYEREREEEEKRQRVERERDRERQRKARLRVHKPAPPSTIRYSDYAYMPYVSTTTTTTNNVPPPPQQQQQMYGQPLHARTVLSSIPGPSQTQSARTSPVYQPSASSYRPPPLPPPTATTAKHFDAVRFEVERTQGYVPTAASDAYTSTSRPYYTPPAPPAEPVVQRKYTRNPYPQLSPPTPVTSTKTSPVTGVVDASTAVCRGPCCVVQHRDGYLTTTNEVGYQRSCVSAYASPAMDYERRFGEDEGRSAVYPVASTATTTTTGYLTAKEREDLAYAQAQVNHHQQQQQQVQHKASPQGVPSMPFANAGPPGVCQMGGGGYGYGGGGGAYASSQGQHGQGQQQMHWQTQYGNGGRGYYVYGAPRC